MCNNSLCGCNSNPCLNLGPFTAGDPHCATPHPHRHSYLIPYASDNSFFLYDGTDFTPAQIGFGSVDEATIDADRTITLNGDSSNHAFANSQAGSISAIAATFTTAAAMTLTGGAATVEVRARIYVAPTGSKTFSPTNATVVILSESATVPVNTIKVNTASISPPGTDCSRGVCADGIYSPYNWHWRFQCCYRYCKCKYNYRVKASSHSKKTQDKVFRKRIIKSISIRYYTF